MRSAGFFSFLGKREGRRRTIAGPSVGCLAASFVADLTRFQRMATCHPPFIFLRRAEKVYPTALNCSSISTWCPATSRLFWLASPTTASISLNIASVMPFLRAAAVCAAMQ
jgi:hypothetical protein